MKKKLSFFFAVLALLLTGQTATAQTFVVGDLSFTVTDADAKTVSVSKTDGITGNVVIPPSVSNESVTYAVTSVAENGFASTAITGVTIPASVTSLGSWAFRECGSLASITIEDSDEPLALVAGYYSSFAWSAADKTIYIGRDFTLTGGDTPFSDVTSVVFSNKVTTIPNNLFYGNTKLKSITIGDGVTTIGSTAFYNTGTDDGVEELQVTLGSNIEIIKESAFNSCSKLKTITLPSTLTVIEGYAFNATALEAITIPESVDSLGSRVFGECKSLANIHIDDKAEALKMIAGYYGTFNYSDADKSVYLGRELMLSENSAPFINVTDVEFGPTITAISNNMFRDVTKLKSVIIGDGVTTIGSYAFYNVGTDDGVEELQVTLGSNIEIIKNDAFNSCSKLKAITLPSKLKVIEQYAFSATALESITIPESVDSLGSRVFGDCKSLANIHIDDKAEALKMIAGYYGTFNYSDADKSVYLGRELMLSENSAPFINVTDVEFGPTITAISNNMFRDVTKLKSVIIGDGVTTIGSYAFYNVGTDDGVEELQVTLGSNIEIIKNDAFNSCSKLKAITLPSKLKVIEQYAFAYTALEAIIIPESVDSLGSRVFGDCNSLANIHINDKAEALKMIAGYYGTFAYEAVEAGKTIYIGRDLKLSENSGPFSYPEGSQIKSVTFGDMVTTITPYMLNEASKMGNLVIGNGVTTIGDYAFRGVGTDDSIEELQVTMGANVETIGAGIFQNCSKLKQVILPATLNAIPNETFSGTGLTAVSIPAKTTSVGQRAFAFCNNLTDITIEDGTEPLEFAVGYNGVFYSSDATDKNVYVGRNLTYTDGEQLVSNIATLELGPQLTTIKNKMFDGSTLTSVKTHWVDALTTCPENAFNSATYSGATLYVPGGTIDTYKATDYWNNFTNTTYWSYVVTLTSSAHGKLAVGTNEANNGSTLFRLPLGEAFDATLTADTGYELTAFTDDDAAVTPLPTTTYHRANSTDAEFVALNATFTPIVYPITYDLAGGALAEGQENPATYTIESAAITLKNPTRRGYTFEGWTGTDLTEASKSVTIAAGSIGERSYTATWKIITYTLTYDLAGGSVATENPATYTVETESFTLTNPTKAGYTFAGWTGTDLTEATTTVTIAKGTIDNRSYTATWTPNPYKVHFNANNGTGTMADQNFVYDAAQALTENAFTRNGYTFNGWNTKADGTGTPYADKASVKNLTTEANATVNLYAQWQVITYTLTYDLAGGSVATANPTEYTIETAAFTLTNPTKDHYVFAGWTGTGLSEATVNVTIANGSTGNRSYTATWEKETYAVNLTSNNAALVTLSTAAPQYQDNVVVTIDNSTAAELVEFTVDGVNHLGDLDSDGKYTITNVQADVEVVVNFSSSTTVAVLEQEWATFVANKAVDFFGTGLTAYIVTGRNTAGTAVILEEVSTVPANTPVVLNGTTGSYTIPYVASSATDVSANLLKRGTGSAVNAGTGVSRYVLSAEGATAVFKKIGATPATVPTNKAYLEISESSSAPQLSIEIGGGTTGIFSISGISEQDEIYDMQGRKVEHVSKKGLYIINGKKVVIK